jgi:hypothetical protein
MRRNEIVEEPPTKRRNMKPANDASHTDIGTNDDIDTGTAIENGTGIDAVNAADTSIKIGLSAGELIFRDSNAYCNRLRSFQPNPNFARDILISPITCARFGWTCATATSNENEIDSCNSSSNGDILQCNQCDQMIAAKFHEDLSPQSHFKLALTYRNMLASKHLDTCPHAMDAKRWLIVNPQQQQQQQTTTEIQTHTLTQYAPHYMIPMSDEYQIMADSTDTGFITREFILKQALSLMRMYPTTSTSIQLHVSDDIISNIQKIFTVSLNELYQLIIKPENNTHHDQDLCSNDVHPCDHDHAQKTSIPITREIFLLSLFGWRTSMDLVNTSQDLDSGQQPHQPSFLHVHCRMCLNQCQIPYIPSIQTSDEFLCGSRDGDESNPNKRRRIDPASCDNTNPTFDLINSHRHYCPMTCGFVKDISPLTINDMNAADTDADVSDGAVVMTKPGWEIFLSSLHRGIQNSSVVHGASYTSPNIFDGAKVLEKIREALRQPSSLQ